MSYRAPLAAKSVLHHKQVRHTSLDWLAEAAGEAQAITRPREIQATPRHPWFWCECERRNLQTQPRESGSYWTVRPRGHTLTHLFLAGSATFTLGVVQRATDMRSRGTVITNSPTVQLTLSVLNPSVEQIKWSAARGRNTIALPRLIELHHFYFRASNGALQGFFSYW
jgi:hypothetical protein